MCVRACVCVSADIISSLRAEGKVKHCRIEVDGGQYCIGSAVFDSLTELIQYYEANPLYRRMKLKYAINDDLLKSLGEAVSCHGIGGSHDVT